MKKKKEEERIMFDKIAYTVRRGLKDQKAV